MTIAGVSACSADVLVSEERPECLLRSFLGQDQTIKVDYRDLGRKKSTQGLWTKSTTQTFKFVTTVKNTKKVPARVVVAGVCVCVCDTVCLKSKLLRPDILPRSTDEVSRDIGPCCLCVEPLCAAHQGKVSRP